MYINRYASDNLINGKLLGTNGAIDRIRSAISDGSLPVTKIVLSEPERLDTLAGKYYGDGRLWWVIAMASGIGWWLQVPPGTRVLVPTDIKQVMSLV